MSRMVKFVLTPVLLAGLLAGAGCSGESKVESIEGKVPADYREEVEKGLANPVPQTPAKAKGAGAARKSR